MSLKRIYFLFFAFLFFGFKLQAFQQMTFWKPPVYQQQKAIGYDSKTFLTPDSLKADVNFWIEIYTKYSTRQGVFHLAGDAQKKLGEIDLTDIYANPKWSEIRKEKEAEVLVNRIRRRIAKQFGIKKENSIRLQMGLRDRMLQAIKISGLYLPEIEKIFIDNKLPIELTRIIFVESSFQVQAGSKAGASGLWQIMPELAKKFKYIQSSYDKRNDPYYSSLLAARILKENYQILKSWPLAVTAYNHGVGSLKKIVKKYNSRDIGFLADNVNTKKSFGFASRNFYATFLAALHVEAHANLYFPEPVMKFEGLKLNHVTLKKDLKYEELLSFYQNDHAKLKFYNPHLRSKYLKVGRTLPAKTILSLPHHEENKTAEIEESK